MKLYRPVPITSAEQAEALPEGTIITNPGYYPQEKFGGLWGREGNTSEQLAEQRDWTALVPIEAEEEFTAMGTENGEHWIAHIGPDGIDGSREEAERYVDRFGGFIAHRNRTPWEEAQ